MKLKKNRHDAKWPYVLLVAAIVLVLVGCGGRESRYGYWPPEVKLPQYCTLWEQLIDASADTQQYRDLTRQEMREVLQAIAQHERRCPNSPGARSEK